MAYVRWAVAYWFIDGLCGGLGSVGLCVFTVFYVEILFMIVRRNCISAGAKLVV
jgi:hypothetical protein